MGSAEEMHRLRRQILACRKCPRLRDHCKASADHPPKRFVGETYHGKPVPGFGEVAAWLWIIGLAPGAHGANRTGRVFTGDRSGDFLFAALHRAGIATLATSTHAGDGQQLLGCYISGACRCAPPGNRPTAHELANCHGFLKRELILLSEVKVVLALGAVAWRAAIDLYEANSTAFGHGATTTTDKATLVASYHVSPLNTQTGKLTETMFDDVLALCNARR